MSDLNLLKMLIEDGRWNDAIAFTRRLSLSHG